MQNGLDRLLATYCSPTLAGIKPASLVSCDRNLYPDLPQRLKEYRDAFSAREIHFEIVCACSARFLLLVYSKPQLERRMADPQVQHVLRHFAYPVGQPLDVLLRNLKRRIAMSKDFPHEIGLFLGYPPEDVEAFISGSSECKLCGYWKVYGDVDGARERFACYDACRLCLCRMLAAGNTISQLLQTA